MNTKTALMFGDICADPGIRAIYFGLKNLISLYSPSVIIANGENSDDGYGISETSANKIFEAGVNIITLGNHTFDNNKSDKLLTSQSNIIRPANLPSGNIGNGYCIFKTNDDLKIGCVNLHTPSGIQYSENLYTTAEHIIGKISKITNLIFVDLHGEYSWQKEAFAFEFDGRVTAICGTHTHIQTLDEKILPKGTAYITDLGMCGCQNSVIGGDIALSLQRARTGVSMRVPHCDNSDEELHGVLITFDCKTGKAEDIKRI